MKICVIHGSPRKGNTYKAAELIIKRLEELEAPGVVEISEYHLPKDMPQFCTGCYSCFMHGGEKCPHYKFIRPILDSIKTADGLIMTTPVYALAESAQIKALLDHLAYIFIPHRPVEEMFSKIGLVVSSTAGAGTGKAIAPVKRSLKYWGFRRVISSGFSLYALNWDEMPDKKQKKIEDKLNLTALRFRKLVNKRQSLQSGLFTRFWFFIMGKMISGYEDNSLDKQYWISKGWIKGKNKPF